MRYLNLGCGFTRPKDPDWTNLDDLFSQHAVGSPERHYIEAPNYVNHVIGRWPLPFQPETFDCVMASHLLEHFDAQDAVHVVRNCITVLKPGGVLIISVPDASYFRKVDAEDRNENWQRLFGVTDPKNPIPTWRTAALFFVQHRVVLTEDALWCYLREAGFEAASIRRVDSAYSATSDAEREAMKILNRIPFSLVMSATK